MSGPNDRDETRLVGVSETGRRVGEDHPRATLTDSEVELIRQLAEGDQDNPPMSHREIAKKFEISRGTVGDIVSFRRRAAYPVGWRRVRVVIRGVDIATGDQVVFVKGQGDA